MSNGIAGLGRRALLFRVAHALFAFVQLGSLGYVWVCAVRRRRDRLLALSVGMLLVEGAALVVGRGNCPFGPLQRQWGDPVPLFELLLPPRAAKAAIPVLALVAVGGLLALAVRWRRPAPAGLDGGAKAGPGSDAGGGIAPYTVPA